MLKYFILLFNLLGLFLYHAFVDDGITVTPSVPPKVTSGQDFVVELTISKKSAEGFAMLEQEVPKGFTVKEIETKGATFTFSKRLLKFVWTSLPSDAEYKVSYKVSVDQKMNGPQLIGGAFYYVLNNVKQTIPIPLITVEVVPPAASTQPPAPTAEAPAQTPAPDTTKTASSAAPSVPVAAVDTTKKTEPQSSVTCNHNLFPGATGEYVVEATINKSNLSGFAKFQETIPAGYTATAVKVGTSSFTFSDQKVKFVWISLPAEETLTVSYKIKADKSVAVPTSIEGIFSYIENDETKKYILNPIQLPAVDLTNPSAAASAPANPSPVTENKKDTATVAVAKPAPEPEKPSASASTDKISNIPAPQASVVYKVQIAALHKPVKPSFYKTKNNITEEINTEMHEGWTKYTVGSFNEYKMARDHREDVRTKNIQGPFVAAYNTGKRITVQEALMITSQKWYK